MTVPRSALVSALEYAEKLTVAAALTSDSDLIAAAVHAQRVAGRVLDDHDRPACLRRPKPTPEPWLAVFVSASGVTTAIAYGDLGGALVRLRREDDARPGSAVQVVCPDGSAITDQACWAPDVFDPPAPVVKAPDADDLNW